MAARGAVVDVHHIRDSRPMGLPAADLYLFSSPGRLGRPVMNEILQGKGLVRVAEDAIHVTRLKGTLEDGWEHRSEEFTAVLPALKAPVSP
jgi:hypothetical protein